MILKKILKSLKIAFLSLVMATSATPVFASDESFETSYPPQVKSAPGFYISRIDLTNNQIEFTFNVATGKKPVRFGAAWIDNRTEEYINTDIRSYKSVNEPGMTKVFWSDDYDLELENYHSSERDVPGFLERYIVDSEVDLKQNSFYNLFFMVETEDGEKWASRVNYERCGREWVDGKTCSITMIINSEQFDNIDYYPERAPEKFMIKRTIEEMPKEETVDESIPNSSDTKESLPEMIESEESGMQDESDDIENVEIEDEVARNTEVEETPVLIATVDIPMEQYVTDTNDVVEEIETVDVVEAEDETSEDEAVDEVMEGFGSTTLEVPILGEVKSTKCPECERINILPYIIFGAGIGIISTLFLLFIVKRVKTLRSVSPE